MEKAKFVLSKSKVLEQYNKVKGLADRVSYSSKTNQYVTEILEQETDALFSVHFENELQYVTDKSRAWFIAQAWSAEGIERLFEQGVNKFVVDNEQDLDTLLKVMHKGGAKASILLRVKLKEHTLKTERYFVFGMPSKIVNKRIIEIRSDKSLEGKMEELGVHFHRKTQNMSEWNLKNEIENILEKDVLEKIDVVNIGGGLPCEYANTNADVLPGIFKKISEFRQWLMEHKIKLIIEPGRFIAGPACRLETTILGVHENTVIVNASVYNTNMDALIVPVKLKIEGELAKGEGRAYSVKGETPCSMDLFRYRAWLSNPIAGNKLVFLNAGAYNFSTDFCDLEKLKTEIVD